ncbi:MAG: hypothetical protein WAN66_18265 [Limnoraphis robusta]|uniref:Uncharacterized protein n=1 Tax=Limnoraphis robusta CS-951 TaxID=1637645 RepID=A0A0F5YA43_9CYAN|nr:hypothetical protein [Limnoraphis robusta]KKD35759.1 hypothetical protein WN50_23540 [Limnoraphis robusta CS-951]
MEDLFNDDSQSLFDFSSSSFGNSFFDTKSFSSSAPTSSQESTSDHETRDENSSDNDSHEENSSDHETRDNTPISTNISTNNSSNFSVDDFILNSGSISNTFNDNSIIWNDHAISTINPDNFSSISPIPLNQHPLGITISISYNAPPTTPFDSELQQDPLTGDPITESFIDTETNLNNSIFSHDNSSIENQSISDIGFDANPIGSNSNYNLPDNIDHSSHSLSLGINEPSANADSTWIISVSFSPLEMPDPTTPSNSDTPSEIDEEVTPSENSSENVTDSDTLISVDSKNIVSQRISQMISEAKALSSKITQLETKNNVFSSDNGHAAIDNLSGMKELGSMNC